jgi:hypothetical protein
MISLRRTLMLLLAIGVAAASGCVYWRLLKFKQQLGDFPSHFAFAGGSSYALVCLHPLLEGGDVDGLMGVAPSRREQGDGLEWRVYDFIKDPADASAPLTYRLGFAEGKLVRIEFPAQFTPLFPEDGLRELLASLGKADVDRAERSARARLARERLAARLPDRARLAAALGEPSERAVADSSEIWTYRYRLDTSSESAAARKRRALGEFRFDAEGRLTRLAATIGKHILRFDVEEVRAAARAAQD